MMSKLTPAKVFLWLLLSTPPPYPLKERRLKERAAPYWFRIGFIMKATLKERPPEGTPQLY